MTDNLTTEGKTMAQQQSLPAENPARADDIACALRQLRKWGFRITREPRPVDEKSDPELAASLADSVRDAQARSAACAFLGLDGGLTDMSRQDVTVIARALMQNAEELPALGLPLALSSRPEAFFFLPPADASTFNVMDAKNTPDGVDFLVRILPQAAGVELDDEQTADLRGLIEALPAGASLASLIHSIKEHDAGRLGLNVQQYEALAPLFEALLLHRGQK